MPVNEPGSRWPRVSVRESNEAARSRGDQPGPAPEWTSLQEQGQRRSLDGTEVRVVGTPGRGAKNGEDSRKHPAEPRVAPGGERRRGQAGPAAFLPVVAAVKQRSGLTPSTAPPFCP